jgi:hypothetical protein
MEALHPAIEYDAHVLARLCPVRFGKRLVDRGAACVAGLRRRAAP